MSGWAVVLYIIEALMVIGAMMMILGGSVETTIGSLVFTVLIAVVAVIAIFKLKQESVYEYREVATWIYVGIIVVGIPGSIRGEASLGRVLWGVCSIAISVIIISLLAFG